MQFSQRNAISRNVIMTVKIHRTIDSKVRCPGVISYCVEGSTKIGCLILFCQWAEMYDAGVAIHHLSIITEHWL